MVELVRCSIVDFSHCLGDCNEEAVRCLLERLDASFVLCVFLWLSCDDDAGDDEEELELDDCFLEVERLVLLFLLCSSCVDIEDDDEEEAELLVD